MSGYVARPPRELLPGLIQWTVAWHRYPLESYAIRRKDGCVVIDPSEHPPRAIGPVDDYGVAHVILTNHYHERAAAIWQRRFTARVWAPAGDAAHLEATVPDEAYVDGAELPGGLRAIALGTISPGEHALFWPENRGVLFVGDALGTTSYWTHGERPLGAHPRARPPHALHRLLDERFTSLAVGHGEPILDTAHVALQAYLEGALRDG